MGRLDNRVVLISGAARGQGAAEARLFVAEGAHVLLGDVLDDEGKQVAEELGDAATYVHLDVTVAEDWAAAVHRARTEYGKLDGLVNNAGVMRLARLDNTSRDDFALTLDVNQLGVFLGMQAVIPAMEEAGGGTIVNVSSIGGLVGMAGLAAYSASKFAVLGLSRTAAIELGPRGIRVNTVCPGVIRTPMTSGMPPAIAERVTGQLPLRRLGEPEDVAGVVLFLTGAESAFCTGAEFVVDGGQLAGSATV